MNKHLRFALIVSIIYTLIVYMGVAFVDWGSMPFTDNEFDTFRITIVLVFLISYIKSWAWE